jgi:hypothetical protein
MHVVPHQFGEAGPTVDKRKVWVIARQHPGEAKDMALLFALQSQTRGEFKRSLAACTLKP